MPDSREYCGEYFTLRTELAAGIEGDRVKAQIDGLKVEIERLRSSGAGQDVDPQISLLSRLFGHGENQVRLSLIIVVALLVEVGSSLGLFLATNHGMSSGVWSHEEAPELKPLSDTEVRKEVEAVQVESQRTNQKDGDVVDFALECLWPEPDGLLTATELFDGYRQWCESQNLSFMKRERFDEEFQGIAERVGLACVNKHYPGISLEQRGHS